MEKFESFLSATALQFYYNAEHCKVEQHRTKCGMKKDKYYCFNY